MGVGDVDYVSRVAEQIGSELRQEALPDEPVEDLLRIYAVLALALGEDVLAADVHDAWVAWKAGHDQSHVALLPFDSLDSETAREDLPFLTAIRSVARAEGLGRRSSRVAISLGDADVNDAVVRKALLPNGEPATPETKAQYFELYRMMVNSSEALVARRQGVNTFFLTMNGLILTAVGLFVRGGGSGRPQAAGILVLAIAGAALCIAWRSLIISFGQLNRGKFAIINTMEKVLAASIYAAEWEALERGSNPKVYRSFTSREIFVPIAFVMIYTIAVVMSGIVLAGLWDVAK